MNELLPTKETAELISAFQRDLGESRQELREARLLNKHLIEHSEELLNKLALADNRVVVLTNRVNAGVEEINALSDTIIETDKEWVAQLRQSDAKIAELQKECAAFENLWTDDLQVLAKIRALTDHI